MFTIDLMRIFIFIVIVMLISVQLMGAKCHLFYFFHFPLKSFAVCHLSISLTCEYPAYFWLYEN